MWNGDMFPAEKDPTGGVCDKSTTERGILNASRTRDVDRDGASQMAEECESHAYIVPMGQISDHPTAKP